MAARSKKTYVIHTAQGNEVEVSATEAVEDEAGSMVRLYDGDALVGSFRGYSSLYIK